MKALKQKTRQPEAYLKEVLPDIAQLIKSGTFSSNYKRYNIFDERANPQEGLPPDEIDDDETMEFDEAAA
jgi:transcription initiation factor TFIIF subunit beta